MSTGSLRLRNYTAAARRAIAAGQKEADARGHAQVLPLHLFWALLDVRRSAFVTLEGEADALAGELRELLGALPSGETGKSYLAPTTLELLRAAEAAANAEGEDVHEQRLAWALARVGRGFLATLLDRHGLGPERFPAPPPGTCPRAEPERAPAPKARDEPAPELPAEWRPALARALAVVTRPSDPVAFLIGAPGTGRTSFLRCLERASGLGACTVTRVDVPSLPSDEHGLREALASRASPSVVLALDHVDYAGSRAQKSLAAALRAPMIAGTLRAILATSLPEHSAAFAGDPLFEARSTRVTLPALPAEVLAQLLALRAAALGGELRASSEVLAAVLRLTPPSSSGYQPPGASCRLLETALARASLEEREASPGDVVEVADAAVDPAEERARLVALEATIGAEVKGQDEAVATVCRRVRFTKLGLDRRTQRPDGAFLLIGPSGVGKTQLAKAMARALYGDLTRLVRFDMSEYRSEHEYAKLIGAPSGYVGNERGGLLTEQVTEVGRGVLLLDEIEKASPSVLNLLLQVLDEGWLTDGRGRKADFSSFTIVMTSNLGRELWASERRAVGFGAEARALDLPDEEATRRHLARVLPTELIGRLDAIVPFHPLDEPTLHAIAAALVAEEVQRWRARGKVLDVAEDVVARVVREGNDPQLGARHLERNLERLVLSRIGEAVMTDAWAHARDVRVTLEGGDVRVTLS